MSQITKHVLKPLPYSLNALAPFISEETLRYHYGKHHQSYVNNLNNLLSLKENSDFANKSLIEIIQNKSVSAGLFNNAAQVYNHDFYWESLTPPKSEGNPLPTGKISEELIKNFGSYESFKDQFSKASTGRFGSGWAWLVQNTKTGKLEIMSTSNADNPLTTPDLKPILTCDVWEHAYYIDYRNDRGKYVQDAFWKLVNWDFANKNLQ
ncbi:superoxide dismutase [Neocallimastix lanati (nom. inval.)]|jgi:Fe-Mn family superoxide dismutase|uniref:Superoxide dismutase n=1 Tax=Neocallimastix californiae TaxID=1754190 RepID=A0A1Y2CFU5_9FUNG|nr:superoxide dismutase [Neocallimastix sp. JGI-2020a]ORY45796.1 superoxide dismutase [Neocallimastix californiae]|eukprot:ORY45796.1 superoxide dismutase [Neocallimastix californiae]